MITQICTFLFGEKFVVDDRQPFGTFVVQGVSWEVLAPELGFWIQIYILSLLQTMVQRLFSYIVYNRIVLKRGTSSAYLIGWGVVIPLSLAFSFVAIDLLGIQNKILRLTFSALPTSCTFRTLEAMYETSPPMVESSLYNYSKYCSTLHHFQWSQKTGRRVPIQRAELVAKTVDLAITFTILSVLLSIQLQYNYTPFSSPVELDSFTLHWKNFSWSHLADSYCLVVVIYFALKLLFEMDAWKAQLGDLSVTKTVFRNPLWASTGPRDFWSSRWNLMIHRILKHGVYLVTGKSAALTFLASGLLHELSWQLMGLTETPGKLTAFFLWNGVVVLLEPYLFAPLFSKLVHCGCPVWIVSTLVVTLVLPVAHWYTGDWAWGGVLEDFKLGLWIVRPTTST